MDNLFDLARSCMERSISKNTGYIPQQLQDYHPSSYEETEFFMMGAAVPSDDDDDDNEDEDYIIVGSDDEESSSEDEDDGERLPSDDESDDDDDDDDDDNGRRKKRWINPKYGAGCDCDLHTEMVPCVYCPNSGCKDCTWYYYNHDKNNYPAKIVVKTVI